MKLCTINSWEINNFLENVATNKIFTFPDKI